MDAVIPIRGDGNCCFRSLSKALCGTEVNHDAMRHDILKFLENEVKLHQSGEVGHDWWG